MTVLERKARLVRAILNDTDEKRFVELERTYQRLAKREPCMYTVEELHDSLVQARLDYIDGKGISSDEMRKRHAI
jgi:hypothetical protein